MNLSFPLTKRKSLGLALALTYMLFVSFTAVYTGELSFVKSTFLFIASMVGPIVALSTLWYAPLGTLLLGLCLWAVFRKTSNVIQLVLMTILLMGWSFFGMKCFSIATGG